MERRQRGHICPGCGSRNIERVRRHGLEKLVLSLVGRRAYLCLSCRRRFYNRPSGA